MSEQKYKNERKYFKVSIDGTSLTPTSDEQKGFVDPFKSQDYDDWTLDNEIGKIQLPTTDETSIGYSIKARGYNRWKQLVLNLSKGGIFYLGDVVVDNLATHYVSPTTVEFVVGYESFDGMVCDNVLYDSEIADSKKQLFGTEALKRLIAMSLVNNYFSIDMWFDGSSEIQGNIQGSVYGKIIMNSPSNESDLENRITEIENLINIAEVVMG